MTEHAFLAPSSAGSWGPGGCPAYPRMAAKYPDGGGAASDEGTAAHWYLSEAFAGREHTPGTPSPNGVAINQDMVDGAAAMLADMREIAAIPGVQVWVEQRVSMPVIHADNWGTLDFGAVDTKSKTIYTLDFKYGHKSVPAFENWQLIDYSVGIAREAGVTVEWDWTLDYRVYQPRDFTGAGTCKQCVTFGATYKAKVDKLRLAAQRATQPNAPMSTGAHCIYCPARHACPAMLAVGGVGVDIAMEGVPVDMTPQGAGALLRTIREARERLENLETGLEAQVLAGIRAGGVVLGWEITTGPGRDVWTQDVDDVAAMADLCGVDIRKPLAIITPSQARKKGLDDAVISQYSARRPGEVQLAPIDPSATRKAFS